MGGSKKQTVGYEYPYDLQFGLCYGADALLEFRGGDATAWSGQVTDNATVAVNAPHLWGGQDNGGEGGIVGDMDIMFGDPAQEPHPYLVERFDQDSALRGKVTVLFRDTIYGAYNPYPKPPAFKVRRILAAWPGDEAWYPERAAVPLIESEELSPTSSGWRYLQVSNEDAADYSADDFDDSAWATGTAPFGNKGPHPFAAGAGFPVNPATFWDIESAIWVRRRFTAPATSGFSMEVFVDNWATVWVNGVQVLPRTGSTTTPGSEIFHHPFHVPGSILRPGPNNTIALKAEDYGAWSYAAFRIVGTGGLTAMNPAHLLYYSFVSPTMEGLPAAMLDDAHWRVGAETLFNEGFGLCTEWVPGSESVEQFRQRICNVIGGFLAKSRRDGKWRLHLPRGQYVLEDLPVLTDDDVLEWKEEPSTIDDAVNQLQTRWFDPVLKESRITPAEHALGAIDAFGGVISQTVDYPEIPHEPLALRKNSQELQARSTPLRRINPVCNRKVAFWDVGTYFRVQCPRRGIADMVMLLVRNDVGESPTSACRITAMEDIWTMPATSYTGPQPPVDYNPPQIPLPAPSQRAFEAPYVELAATLPSGTLEALAPESGYLQFVAQQPASGLNYTLATAADGEDFEEYTLGDWCPTAVVSEAVGRDQKVIPLASGSGLAQVEIGSAVLWDDEICRVDGLDLEADPVQLTLGRGCADTVATVHEAGSRIWFYDEWAATDQREYALGEMVTARALTRTSRARLRIDDAPSAQVEMQERHARPYPPGRVRINDAVSPPEPVLGEVEVTWAHRDRLLQADQLFDQEAASIGPEPGTTYNVRWYSNDDLVHSENGLTDPVARYEPDGGLIRVEIESECGGLVSWQCQAREFVAGSPLLAEDGTPITTEDNQAIIME